MSKRSLQLANRTRGICAAAASREHKHLLVLANRSHLSPSTYLVLTYKYSLNFTLPYCHVGYYYRCERAAFIAISQPSSPLLYAFPMPAMLTTR